MLSKNKVNQLCSLHQKKGRNMQNLFIAEGQKLVQDLLVSDLRVMEVYFVEDGKLELGSKLGLDSKFELDRLSYFVEIAAEDMKKISALTTPTNCLAVVEIPDFVLDKQALLGKLSLVVEDVRDPGNLGTIIRIADWFGIDELICSVETVDCYNPKVVQATMGSIARVKVHYLDLVEFIKELNGEEEMSGGRSKGLGNTSFEIYGTLMDGERIDGVKLSDKGLIVIGNEGRGISDALQALLTKKISIPRFGHVEPKRGQAESLNAAVATALVCAEFRRG